MKAKVSLYVLKVWGTAVALGALSLYFYDFLTRANPVRFNSADLEIIFLIIMLGAAYSIPCAMLLWVICKILVKQKFTILTIKLWLSFTGVLLTFGLLIIIGGLSNPIDIFTLKLGSFYGTPIIGGIWFYNLSHKTTEIKSGVFDTNAASFNI